ncbi:hypothetical protein BHM03_00015542 [Ensete ventricosum]|uniref:Uncharacterized protein n=1 Tax=Ensete ventricosum TaxID=4639 RepID=A0A445MEF0_ENSVE|nr:hypothetical protein BHM03_00015542 [Ensete ventricosum]
MEREGEWTEEDWAGVGRAQNQGRESEQKLRACRIWDEMINWPFLAAAAADVNTCALNVGSFGGVEEIKGLCVRLLQRWKPRTETTGRRRRSWGWKTQEEEEEEEEEGWGIRQRPKFGRWSEVSGTVGAVYYRRRKVDDDDEDGPSWSEPVAVTTGTTCRDAPPNLVLHYSYHTMR